jgi:hypothetical protein
MRSDFGMVMMLDSPVAIGPIEYTGPQTLTRLCDLQSQSCTADTPCPGYASSSAVQHGRLYARIDTTRITAVQCAAQHKMVAIK